MLESYVTKTRDKKAALRFMKKALKRHGSPEEIRTDGLRSCKAAMSELGNAHKQEIGRWANVYNHFNLERHLIDRQTYQTRRSAALAEWQRIMA